MDLLIFRMDGSPYTDIPIEFEMPFSGSPAVQDLDSDGDLEIVIGSTNSLIAVDIKDLGNSNNYWNMYRGNVHRTGYLGSTSGSGTISVSHIPDWNLVGLPMSVEDPYHLSVYPGALEGTLYSFDGNYVQENDFITGTGYWLRFPDGGTTIISGSTIHSLIISMMNDWNLISGISSSVPATSIQDPEGIILPGTLYEFDGSYIQAETLEPGKGYWIRSAGPGEIIISDDIRAKRLPFISKMDGANTISFNDQTLYFGVTVPDNEKLSYSAPPKPPSGVFDARFQGDWIYCEDSGKIELTDQAEPLSISFNIANKTTWVLINIESNEEYDLSGSGELIIAEVLNEFILQKNSVLPHSYSLHQNFPNPFNPVTSLRYDLPEQSFVTLTIYDLIGREITQLVNTTQEAGFRSVQWDATDSFGKPVSAGIYLYKITTGEFVQTKKMVLVK